MATLRYSRRKRHLLVRLPTMGSGGTLQQEIAVFGESGSGKTVLLSSFYGAAQEPQFVRKSLFRVVADDFGLFTIGGVVRV